MNIEIYTYCPSPSSYCKEGRKEYEKRLSRYCKMKHTLLKNTKQLEKKKASFLTSCEASKKQLFLWVHAGSCKSNMDSGQLAEFIEEKGIQGISSLTFLVGFPDEEDFPSRINACSLSISRMEIDSDLLSLILEEQIYRAYRIIHKEPYHK